MKAHFSTEVIITPDDWLNKKQP